MMGEGGDSGGIKFVQVISADDYIADGTTEYLIGERHGDGFIFLTGGGSTTGYPSKEYQMVDGVVVIDGLKTSLEDVTQNYIELPISFICSARGRFKYSFAERYLANGGLRSRVVVNETTTSYGYYKFSSGGKLLTANGYTLSFYNNVWGQYTTSGCYLFKRIQ